MRNGEYVPDTSGRNTCRYYEYEISMFGEKCLGCTHPRRKDLNSSWLSRLLDIIRPKRKQDCAASAGYEGFCPFYEKQSKRGHFTEVER
jgi:hypothetical protein